MASNKISLFFKSLLLGIFISGFGVNGHAATLPAGYTELQYIESTGTQYIDTGYIPTTDLSKIEFKFNVSTDNTTIFGVSNSSESRVQMWHYQDRYSSRTFTNTTSNISSVVLSLNIDITGNLDVTNGKLTINGNSGISTDIDYKTNYSYPMYVFALNNEGATPTTIASGKVYYLKVYENGTLVRDFVPAKNASGVIGMYDTVGNRFYTNAGSGTFDAGPAVVANSGPISSVTVAGLVAQNGTPTPTTPIDIVSNNGVLKVRHQSGLPLGYTLLDYIKSTSNIPLGFYTNQNSEIEAKWYKDGAGAQYVYQANSGSALTNNTTAYATDGGGNWRFGNQTISIQAPLNTDIISIQNKNGVWFNNEQQGTYTNTNDFIGDVEFKALGTPSTGYSPMIRISYIKHRQNGVLLGHYVPCVAPDNSIGLYDLIGGVFYTNADATITAGNPVSAPVEIYTDGEVETITDSANHTATVATLLGVGDYRDTQNINTGAITRNVGIKVLDGTEEWGTTYSEFFNTTLSNHIASAPAYCNYFQTVTTGTIPPQEGRINKVWLGTNWVGLGARTKFSTTTQFKQWLADQYAAGTPVIVVYPLATSTTESVAGQTMTTAPVNNRTGGVTGMTITTLLSSGASVVTTIAANAIKIATTAYNAARFSPVVTELNNTIATIRSVVTNTINQTKAIADLQAKKQTRPDEQCPAGKKCLLVEDNEGQPHWYEIIENAYGLPSGYTALEYIEGTGTQWIDTGVNIGENIQTKVKFGKTTNSFTKFGFVIGGGSHYQGLVARTIENSYYMSMYSSSQHTVTITMPDDVFEVTFNTPEHKVIINNTDSFDLVLMSPYEINTTIGVFNTPGTSNNIGIGKVYSFVIKDNSSNSIVRNLVPAKNSSGVIGLYDTVSGTFFTNAGTGTFTAGPVAQ